MQRPELLFTQKLTFTPEHPLFHYPYVSCKILQLIKLRLKRLNISFRQR